MIRAQSSQRPKLVIEEVTDPAAVARAQGERHRRNSIWLASHWPQLLPQSRGKFVAVAGEEGFTADTAAEAWAWAARTHPDDNGALVQYVPKTKGPRIYANRRSWFAQDGAVSRPVVGS